MLSEMDVVRREEFEAIKAMAEIAREENERLASRIARSRRRSRSSGTKSGGCRRADQRMCREADRPQVVQPPEIAPSLPRPVTLAVDKVQRCLQLVPAIWFVEGARRPGS